MGLASSLALRSLSGHRARTIFGVLGIAVGIATVVGLFTLDHNTLIGRSAGGKESWQAEIEVSPSAGVRDPRAELREVPGVTRVAAAFQAEANLIVPGEDVSERLLLVALDAGPARGLGAYHVERGVDLDTRAGQAAGLELPGVLIGAGLAERSGLELGQRIALGRPGETPSKECVDGQWSAVQGGLLASQRTAEFEVCGVLAREGLGRRASGNVVLVDYAVGRELFEGAHVETRYWLDHDASINLERLQSRLGRAWSYDLNASVVIGQAADERAFRNGARFAGVLALVLGLYIIFHTLSVSLIERSREIGVLHALGTTRAQIARIFLLEALVVALLGGLVGLSGGLLMAKVLLRGGVTTIGRGHPIKSFDVPWQTVLPLVAAGVGIALAGCVWPLVRVRHSSTVAVLRGEEIRGEESASRGFRLFAAALLGVLVPGLYFFAVPLVGEAQKELVGILLLALGVLALFVGVPLAAPALIAGTCRLVAQPFAAWWPLAGRLAARAMARGPLRVAGGVAGIALVTAGYTCLRGMTRSLEGEIRIWGQNSIVDKVFVRRIPPSDAETLRREMRALPGVIGFEPADLRTYVPFLIVGLHTGELTAYGPASSDPSLLAELEAGRGIVLSERLARHRGYALGDEVHVRTARDEVRSLPVLAISDAYGYFPHPDERLYAVVSASFLREEFCIDDSRTNAFVLRLEDGQDPSQVEAAVRAHFAAQKISVETGPYLFDWYAGDVRRDFILFDILIVLTAALAGLGILNGQLLAALEHARESGVLKALGVDRLQVCGVVLLEAACIGMIGGLLGVLLGSAMAPIVVAALQTLSGLPLPAPGLGPEIAVGLLGALLLALASALYPLRRTLRADVLAAVRRG